MDLTNSLIQYAILGSFSLVLWFMKNTLTATQEKIKVLEEELKLVRQEYLHKDDFREFKQELRYMFEDIKADLRDLKSKDTL